MKSQFSSPAHKFPLFQGSVDTVEGLIIYMHPDGQGSFRYHTLRPSVSVTTPSAVIVPSGTIANVNDPGSEGELKQDNDYLYIYQGGSWDRFKKPDWDVNLGVGVIADEAVMLESIGNPGRVGYRSDLKTYVIHVRGDGSQLSHWLVIEDVHPNASHSGSDALDTSKPSDINPRSLDANIHTHLNTSTGTARIYNPVTGVWHGRAVVNTPVPAGAGSVTTPFVSIAVPTGFSENHHLHSSMMRNSGTQENAVSVVDIATSGSCKAYIRGTVQTGGELSIRTVFER